MSQARFLVGNVAERVAEIPDGSVDLVLTSPPFLGLRTYLPAGHPDKAHEIGTESTPGAYVESLLDVVEVLAPKLAPHGSMAIELGDAYSGSGGAGGDYNADGLRMGQPRFDGSAHRAREAQGGWPLPKSLCLIPELFRISLVYGFNPLTGRRTPQWRARNVVRWCRVNPPVGALADKVRPATSDIIIVCAGRKRYFDLDAVRTPNARVDERHSSINERRTAGGLDGKRDRPDGLKQNEAGSPPLDHWWFDEDTFDQDAWVVAPGGFPGAHYAVWPPALLIRPILAMCPERVCTECGKPSERLTENVRTLDGEPADLAPLSTTERQGADADGVGHWRKGTRRTQLGWSDCGHDSWRPGLVLDPFVGSGTTLMVATGHGRDAIGIDIDERNLALAQQRVGMLLEVG